MDIHGRLKSNNYSGIGGNAATQETLALLKLLVLGYENIAAAQVAPVEGLAGRIRERH